MNDSHISEPLALAQLLLDVERLAILGVLARQPASLPTLLELTSLRGNILQRHLNRLAGAGLVQEYKHLEETLFRLDRDRVHLLARELGQATHPVTVLPEALLVMEESQRKLAAGYVNRDGSLKELPTSQQRLHAVLTYVVQVFEPGQHYSEKAVNELLKPFFSDTASLRRSLVDFNYLDRERNGSAYWRVEKPARTSA